MSHQLSPHLQTPYSNQRKRVADLTRSITASTARTPAVPNHLRTNNLFGLATGTPDRPFTLSGELLPRVSSEATAASAKTQSGIPDGVPANKVGPFKMAMKKREILHGHLAEAEAAILKMDADFNRVKKDVEEAKKVSDAAHEAYVQLCYIQNGFINEGKLETAEALYTQVVDSCEHHELKLLRDFPAVDWHEELKRDQALPEDLDYDYSTVLTLKEARIHICVLTDQTILKELKGTKLPDAQKKLKGSSSKTKSADGVEVYPKSLQHSKAYAEHIHNQMDSLLFQYYLGSLDEALDFEVIRGWMPRDASKRKTVHFIRQRLALQLDVTLEKEPIDPFMPDDILEAYRAYIDEKNARADDAYVTRVAEEEGEEDEFLYDSDEDD